MAAHLIPVSELPTTSTSPELLIEPHRAALIGHCYRMLGSIADAEDATQEAMVRAWKSYESFAGRASLRNWLYRIATNVCLDQLRTRTRRCRPVLETRPGTVSSELHDKPGDHWLEPVPDAMVVPDDATPAEKLQLLQSVRLAFVAALQQLPPKQRAALLFADVLEWSAADIAESLSTSVAAVNSALQRARTTLAQSNVPAPETPLSPRQEKLLDSYVEAFTRFDVDALTSLLHDDVRFSMPPYELWLEGPASVGAWLRGPGGGCRGSRLVPTAASGSPAYGQYRVDPEGGFMAWGLIVLELRGDRVAGWNTFLDTETLFPRFGLPSGLPETF